MKRITTHDTLDSTCMTMYGYGTLITTRQKHRPPAPPRHAPPPNSRPQQQQDGGGGGEGGEGGEGVGDRKERGWEREWE